MTTPMIIKPREQQLEQSSYSQVPDRKRKKDEDVDVPPSTTAPPTEIMKGSDIMNNDRKREASAILKTYTTGTSASMANKKARETRLEQNRKAARESRRRKKVMIEDLQRSVIFFSRANGALKHQNDELTRLFMRAQAQASVIESTNAMNAAQAQATTTSTSGSAPASASASNITATNSQLPQNSQQQQNQSQGGAQSSSNEATAPAPNAVATPLHAPTSAGPAPVYPPVPVMQPGATMQAMASFQQAAAAAMQVAVQGMRGIAPGASLTALAQPSPTTGSASAQQAYNDTMTALAMQQAAIAASPHLMAQLVGSTCNNGGWVAAPPTSATSAPPTTILPATTTSTSTQATSAIPPSTTTSAPVVTGNTTTSVAAAPVPVAPMPNVTMTKGVGEA